MTGAELTEWVMILETQLKMKRKERAEVEQDVIAVDGISNENDKVQTSNLADRTAKGAVRLRTIDEQIAKLEEKRKIVLDQISALPEELGYVVRRSCFEGKSSAQIAIEIGKPPKHVRRMIDKGLRILSKK